ncbi:hypothetical protein B0J17DRAFT_127785 [Rhizoctonia solani]|nr:hypothetical protein B0J17DRAFT_127785 [Rhizoctonia solani]
MLHVAQLLDGVTGLILVARTFAEWSCQVSCSSFMLSTRYDTRDSIFFSSFAYGNGASPVLPARHTSRTRPMVPKIGCRRRLSRPTLFLGFQMPEFVAFNLEARGFFSTNRHSFQADASNPELSPRNNFWTCANDIMHVRSSSTPSASHLGDVIPQNF